MSDEKMVVPFASGLDAMCWREENCFACKKGYHGDGLDEGTVMVDGVEVLGKCELDAWLSYAAVCDGKIPARIAERIGTKDVGKTWHMHSILGKCKEFEPNEEV